MFDGVPVEQFHQFISTPSPRNASFIQTPPIPASANLNFLSFDPLIFHQSLYQSNHLPPTHTQLEEKDIDIKLEWSDDEVIQLLRIKSSSQNWFTPDFTWDQVSRKLAELGYKRSAEKCKEKFEEETCTSFSSSIGFNKNSSRYLISEEVDEHLYNNAGENSDHHHVTIEPPVSNVNHQEPQVEEKGEEQINSEGQEQKGEAVEDDTDQMTKSKKRKRKHKRFKMVKGLCVDLVNKMMAQQEEMHKKLLEDMANRDEEKMKREEAWRKGEMERLKREIHIREQEQEIARDRQSTITEFLNKITALDQIIPFDHINFQANIDKLPLTSEDPAANQDIGKRWPREEVLALINIRSNVNIGGNSSEYNKGGSLWERISQGMLELGYKRSAKRCKEKWENINKYFRKTKDANKKRSLDSRTCPYYHELSKLYNQEKLASASNSTGSYMLQGELPNNN